jgi:hypothetical protein
MIAVITLSINVNYSRQDGGRQVAAQFTKTCELPFYPRQNDRICCAGVHACVDSSEWYCESSQCVIGAYRDFDGIYLDKACDLLESHGWKCVFLSPNVFGDLPDSVCGESQRESSEANEKSVLRTATEDLSQSSDAAPLDVNKIASIMKQTEKAQQIIQNAMGTDGDG